MNPTFVRSAPREESYNEEARRWAAAEAKALRETEACDVLDELMLDFQSELDALLLGGDALKIGRFLLKVRNDYARRIAARELDA